MGNLTEKMLEQTLSKAYSNLQAGKYIHEGIPYQQWQALLDRYSHFNDQRNTDGYLVNSEIVIDNFHTPRPCLHLMASTNPTALGTWGSFWDQFGGGFSCLQSVLAGKMTSHLDTNYVPTAPEPQDVRRFFIHENEHAWPMFLVPFEEESAYHNCQCRQGLDSHIMYAEREELATELEVRVPPNRALEIWAVRIKNLSNHQRRFSWFASIRINIDSFPFYYFVPRVVCEGILENETLVFLNHDQNNKHPRQAFLATKPLFDGFDMMGEIFHGIGGRSAIPAAVLEGRCRNSLGLQPYAGLIAAVQFEAHLSPGQIKQWVGVYGTCPYEKSERIEYLKLIHDEILTRPEESIKSQNNIWKQRITAHMAKTPDTQLDRYFNVFSKYQARNQARFCRALDKIGYRDVLQDLIGVCECEPDFVRNKLLHTLRYQLEDGRAVRQYEACPGAGHDLRMYMDSSSWIPDTLIRYLEESGDFAILEEQVPYFNMADQQPDESKCGTVYEHAMKAIRSLTQTTGYHGLCRIGYGDWNDALSGIGGQKGVSVWLSCACVYAAQRMQKLAEFLGRTDDAREMSDVAIELTSRINEHAWDGQWYIYAINEKGKPIGSKDNTQGQLHLNVNTWAIFTGIAKAAGRQEQVWKAIEKLATPLGHILLSPPYTSKSREQVGRIADQKPGMFENGSIYLHGEAFYLYALIVDRQGDECYRRLMQTLPSQMVQDITTGPRHQQSNFTVGPDHPNYGAQLFSNFTGSVSWYRRVVERMLGVRAGFDALMIDPCPPRDWKEFEVQKIWRNRTIRIHFHRSHLPQCRITCNGKSYTGQIPLTALSETQINHVEVEFV